MLMTDQKNYDVVVVGAGIAGGVIAKQLAAQGKNVLILEAGAKKSFAYQDYRQYVLNYYQQLIKIPNSPFPNNPNAPQPLVTQTQIVPPGTPTDQYFVQRGPMPFMSSYTRSFGGTMLHWLGTCLRMLPEDFEQATLYGHGRDWPVTYKEMMPWYRMAEKEIGVSADVEDQKFLGIKFEDNYVYPMHKIPQSFLDQKLAESLKGWTYKIDGKEYDIEVVSTPQGRNSDPNKDFANGEGYTPIGAVGEDQLGQRCEGNSSCVPICPVQAKYNGLKTLAKAVKTGRVTIQEQSVASRVLYDSSNGEITGIEYKRYKDPQMAEYETGVAEGTVYVLAAHAVENAKLMLASGMHSTSKLVGKNLMDHPVLLTWGSMPENIGPFRGPGSTSGIPSLRGGEFRKYRAPWRVEIGNWAWNWPMGSPYTEVSELVNKNVFGKRLRKGLFDSIQPKFRCGYLVEQDPSESNTVTIDPQYKDQLGNFKPVINYSFDDYLLKGGQAAKAFNDAFFQQAGVTDHTDYQSKEGEAGFVMYEGEPYWYQGAGHLAGTHLMGTSPKNSVVDKRQRSWDHKNLFLVGCGNMPSMATSNPTLTMTALAFWAAANILEDLG